MPQTEMMVSESFIYSCKNLSRRIQRTVKYNPTEEEQKILKTLEGFWLEWQENPMTQMVEEGLPVDDLAFLVGIITSPRA